MLYEVLCAHAAHCRIALSSQIVHEIIIVIYCLRGQTEGLYFCLLQMAVGHRSDMAKLDIVKLDQVRYG